MQVLHDLRAEAEAIMRLAKARIVGATKQQVGRKRVAIGREQVAHRVKCQSKRIHLSVREELDMGAIGAEAINIAALKLDLLTVGPVDGTTINVSVTGIDP